MYIQRQKIRDSIHRVDEADSDKRTKDKYLQRKRGNHLCCTDMNHQIIRWYLLVF